MSKETNPKGQKAATDGANKLIDHLGRTGTGRDKLTVANEVLADLGDASTEQAGAEAVVTHLKRRGVTDGTIQKAEDFIKRGLPDAEVIPAPSFDPALTSPGSVPAVKNK